MNFSEDKFNDFFNTINLNFDNYDIPEIKKNIYSQG